MQTMNNNSEESHHMGLAAAISLALLVVLMAWLAITALATGIAIV